MLFRGSLLLGVAWSAAVAQDMMPVKVFQSSACSGLQTETATCNENPTCVSSCVGEDCEFSEWEEWRSPEGCTGICTRKRVRVKANNKCGKPCTGAMTESKLCENNPTRCPAPTQACKLEGWSEWTSCTTQVGQKTRARNVTPGQYMGRSCEGSIAETVPCHEVPGASAKAADCVMAAWAPWTVCSSTCGSGHRSRSRGVQNRAVGGGACAGTGLQEVVSCSAPPCTRDCELSNWQQWTGCNTTSSLTQHRVREVTVALAGDGVACSGSMIESKACPRPVASDCVLTDWTPWQGCSATCGGGQKKRTRSIDDAAKNGGFCPVQPLAQIVPCNTQTCGQSNPANDCDFSPWESWTSCSATCGAGTHMRSRNISGMAHSGGKGCVGATKETATCSLESCKEVDCAWSQWTSWTNCTLQCDGGTQTRSRDVVQVPTNGGAQCEPLTKEEVQACNTQSCKAPCRNGTWGDWSSWTKCSATCGPGYIRRQRDQAVSPNSCGFPASGAREEFAPCPSSKPCVGNEDCTLSPWSEWTACSSTCSGVHERNRTILVYASGTGTACGANSIAAKLKEAEPCAFDTTSKCSGVQAPQNCIWADWGPFHACSATCGGGQNIRTRSQRVPAAYGGVPCNGSTSDMVPCNTQPCDRQGCKDCKWGQWNAWSDCTGCPGQQQRIRIVEQYPDDCGLKCEANNTREIQSCPGDCEADLYCAWTEWAAWSACPHRCGSHRISRFRSLATSKEPPKTGTYLYKGKPCATTRSFACSGTQEDEAHCTNQKCDKCVPEDCLFGVWSDWSQPSVAGLCERTRSVETLNNECGLPCKGTTVSTKSCGSSTEPPPEPRDCKLADWAMWSYCTSENSQRYRVRNVLDQPLNGGKPCVGTTRETYPCNASVVAVDCQLSDWTPWSICSGPCQSATQMSSRYVKSAVSAGGVPCTGDLQRVRSCDQVNCTKVDCAMGQWSAWSGCNVKSQRSREREVLAPPKYGGTPCSGGLVETAACTEVAKVDCELADWTEWDACDKTCGVGRTQRERQVLRYPKNGGSPCPANSSLSQITPCRTHAPNDPSVKSRCPAELNVSLSAWSEWHGCTATCGVGQWVRNRSVIRERTIDVEGYYGDLTETAACQDLPPCPEPIDCQWRDWTVWTSCSCSCGGGHKGRQREILREPSPGGQACQVTDRDQIEACNTMPCPKEECTNGKWADWSDWEPCSKTCRGGTTWRSRKTAEESSDCGIPATGLSQQVMSCNNLTDCIKDTDCIFEQWGSWSSCSSSCGDGVQDRERQIEHHATGDGAPCLGPLRQVMACNPMVFSNENPGDTQGCPAWVGEPEDCVLGSWNTWSKCSAACGGGTSSRDRKVVKKQKYGGKPCEGNTVETMGCNMQVCNRSIDCAWSDWEEWGACDKCGGQRNRYRHIASQARNGGKLCDNGAAHETAKCPRECGLAYYCTWGSWTPFSQCSTTCGAGTKTRRRVLELSVYNESSAIAGLWTSTADQEKLQSRVDELQQQHRDWQARRTQQLALSFAAGCFGLVLVAFVSSRSCRRSASRRTHDGANWRILPSSATEEVAAE